MKTILKTVFLAAFLAVMLAPMRVQAIGADELIVREYSKIAVSDYVLPAAATLMNVRYTGAQATNEINVSSGAMNLEAPVNTVKANYNFALAAYDTLGELCAAIHSVTDWTCSLTGGKSDDHPAILTDVAAQSVSAAAGYGIGIGTGTVTAAETIQYINRLGITPMSGKRVALKYCDVQSDAAGTLKVYGKLAKFAAATDGVTRNDTTLVLSPATADDTAEVNGNIYSGYWVEFAKDEHVVISVGNAATAQTATSYISCFWDEK